MEVTAIIYDLVNYNRKEKVHKKRKVFGYKDFSNNKQYSYNRQGAITKYILKVWNKPVILVKTEDEEKVNRILNKNGINHENIKINMKF